MRKRTSRRRWVARCKLGLPIPMCAIVAHQLNKRFHFECLDELRDLWQAALGSDR